MSDGVLVIVVGMIMKKKSVSLIGVNLKCDASNHKMFITKERGVTLWQNI